MKKATLSLLIGLFACLTLHAQDSTSSYKLLWEIKGPHSSQASYLLGTMHVTDERAFQMPDSVLIAIQNSPGFALEVDFDSASYLFLEYLYAAHGESIFDEQTWMGNKTSGSATPEEKTSMDPSELFKLFERQTEHKDEATFLDAFLYRLAREQGKTICGLESIVDQLGLIAQPEYSMSPRTKKAGKKAFRLNDMVEAYHKGDLDALYEMAIGAESNDFFRDEILIKRNYGMAERADSLMHIRPTFFGVGAAHLPGDEGLLRLLQNRGYRVRPVKATYTGMAATALRKEYQPHWSNFERITEGFRIKVPARPYPIDLLGGQFKMYLGMDFPGGLVYCFYKLIIPGDLDEAKMNNVMDAMAKSFSQIDSEIEKDEAINFGELKGKEFWVKKGAEHLRVRILFKDNDLYLLLLGNSPKVIDSPSADIWFNSLELFEPQALTKAPRIPTVDRVNGFSIDLPSDCEYISHQVDGFPVGGAKDLFNVYSVHDNLNSQSFTLLIEDFRSPAAAGELEELMPQSIKFLSGYELLPIDDEFTFPVVDGIKGMEATYFSYDFDLVYRMRCFLRYNRLYLIGMQQKADAVDTLAQNAIFDSFHFLPTPLWDLKYDFAQDSLFSAKFSGKPTSWERTNLAEAYYGRVDSSQVYFFHDPSNSLNAYVEYLHVWEYYSGGNQEIYEAIIELKDFENKDLVGWGAPNSTVVQSRQHVGQSTGDMWQKIDLQPVGNDILVTIIQTPNTPEGIKLADAFCESVQVDPSQRVDKRAPQLQNLIDLAQSTDSTEASTARMAISYYKMQTAELAVAAKICENLPEYELDDYKSILFTALLEQTDEAAFPILQELYGKLEKGSRHRINLLTAVMPQDWAGADDWAIAQLKQDLEMLAVHKSELYLDQYLSQDSLGDRMRKLDFLLVYPNSALRLAGAAGDLAMRHDLPYDTYADQFASILAQSIARKDIQNFYLYAESDMYYTLKYLSEQNHPQWQALAHKALKLENGYFPGYAYSMLCEHDQYPSKAETSVQLANPDSRTDVLFYLLEKGYSREISKKYQKPSYIAEVAFCNAIQENPARLEVVEQRKIYYHGEYQWLFIYRFASSNDRDWLLGFGGPVPMDYLPRETDFPLSGSDFDLYSPSNYKRKTKAWMRANIDDE